MFISGSLAHKSTIEHKITDMHTHPNMDQHYAIKTLLKPAVQHKRKIQLQENIAVAPLKLHAISSEAFQIINYLDTANISSR